MKRFFENNQHQLDDLEREQLWQDIRRETFPGPARPRRSHLRPVFGVTVAVCALAVGLLWYQTRNLTGGGLLGRRNLAAWDRTEEAELPSEASRQINSSVTGTSPAPVEEVVEVKPENRDAELGAVPLGEKKVEETFSEAEDVTLGHGGSGPPARRSGDVMMSLSPQAKSAPTAPAQPQGSVTGGTTPPNGEPYELMYFDHTGVNPFVATEDDSLSTFAVDVDNASYTVVRNYLNRGHLPPGDAIRVEEFVNYFDPGLPSAGDQVFGLNLDGSVSTFGDGYHLLRVGLQGMDVDAEDRKPATLIFVVDISGSMDLENRLGLVKQSLHILLDALGEGDRVGLVVYGSRGEVRLEPTDISRREAIVAAIDGLSTSGATNAHEGLKLAYDLARKDYQAGRVNRLILCTDGVANMGRTQAEEILTDVRHAADEGVTLSAIGFGMGNYNDELLETLSNEGDGNYYYVDQLDEAQRVFKENLTGLLQTIARQVKTQVAFDPRYVQRWRLLGYENRDVADRDFRNDAVDAGEVGAGHRVTALYEVKLVNLPADADVKLGSVHVRFEFPAHDTERAGQVKEISRDINAGALTGGFGAAPARFRLQAVAAEFAEILRGSYWARESDLNALANLAAEVALELEGDAAAAELADLVRKAAGLQPDEPVREELDK